jgi:excisionase family DNA binding protein
MDMNNEVHTTDGSKGVREDAGATRPSLLTVEQAAISLAICRTKVYELLRNGELESVQIGSSRRIPEICVAEYVERLRSRVRTQARSETGCRPFSVDPAGR